MVFHHKMLMHMIPNVYIPNSLFLQQKGHLQNEHSFTAIMLQGRTSRRFEGLHVRVVAGLLNKITLVREEGILNTFQHIHCVHIEVWPISYHTEVALPSLRSIRPPSMTSLSWL
jgi:hypothetical protein